jgi:hypothetical protein
MVRADSDETRREAGDIFDAVARPRTSDGRTPKLRLYQAVKCEADAKPADTAISMMGLSE